MKTLVEVVGLEEILGTAGIEAPYDDFEAIYSDITANPSLNALKSEIEECVASYFSSLELPDHPTLYDHLVLSLRPKDVIATFNWDPFLCLAAERNFPFGGAPKILFLHGNAGFSYCVDCKTGYAFHTFCRKCGKKLKKSPLLYPVNQKNYQANAAIAQHWKKFEEALQCASAFTVFGYSAPKSDIEAIRLMKSAWGDVSKRQLEQTEIIDLKHENDLLTAWEPFINSHHYEIRGNFYESYIAHFPRRSCEAIWNRFMECKFFDPHAFPRNASFPELYDWLKPRMDAERKSNGRSFGRF